MDLPNAGPIQLGVSLTGFVEVVPSGDKGTRGLPRDGCSSAA